MTTASKWLVCAGPGEFLAIAGAIVGAGAAESIEWEPHPTKAYARANELVGTPLNMVVGNGELLAKPEDAACLLAAVVAGDTYLCAIEAPSLQEEVCARGVAAAVAPAVFPRLMRERMGDRYEGQHFAPIGIAATQPLPAPLSPLPSEGGDGPLHGEELPTAPFDQPASVPLRPAGCLPKTTPAATDDLDRGPASAVAVLHEHGVEVEPLVYCPVVEMPQMECEVAGQDEPVPTFCFASARGGVGKSALAVAAALALAREGLSVALIDLDYQFGTCLGYLGAEETDGLFDMGTHPETIRVDARSLARCRTTPERCLAAFEFCRAPEQSEVLVGLSERLVRAARAGADVAIVDLPSGMNEACAQALELADRCLLVCDQRAFSVESLAALQSLCERMGVARTKFVTVLNRCDARHRDESYVSRVQFSVKTPQLMKVVDGGSEVTQLLSIGGAGELVSMRNRFALSAGDMARSLCIDMGCLRAEDVKTRGWGKRGQQAQGDGTAHEKKGGRNGGRKEEACPC